MSNISRLLVKQYVYCMFLQIKWFNYNVKLFNSADIEIKSVFLAFIFLTEGMKRQNLTIEQRTQNEIIYDKDNV